jgi:hypothetical protein
MCTASALRLDWRPGPHCVPATTSPQASARAARPATATRSCAIFCAKPQTPRDEPKTVFRAKYDSLVIRRGHKKTMIALAHKLIRTIYFVLARRKPYRDSTFDYQAASVAKNAPRWIRALKKYGYWPKASAESTKAAAAT